VKRLLWLVPVLCLSCYTRLNHPEVLAESRWFRPTPDADCASCHAGESWLETGTPGFYEHRGTPAWADFHAPAGAVAAPAPGALVDLAPPPPAPTQLVATSAAPTPRMAQAAADAATPAVPDTSRRVAPPAKPASPSTPATSPRRKAAAAGAVPPRQPADPDSAKR
jgi:hypothetical protein